MDVIVNNDSAVNAYHKNNFNEVGSTYSGFADPAEEKPVVVSMHTKL